MVTDGPPTQKLIKAVIQLAHRQGGFYQESSNRSEGVPERRIFSLGALLGWVVWDSVFLVVVGRGGVTRRDPSYCKSGETTHG